MVKKHELTRQEQGITYKKTYEEYYARLRANDWLAAFLIAFGLLENRIKTMYHDEREFRNESELGTNGNATIHRPFKNQVNYLELHGRLRVEEAEEVRLCGVTRNEIIHNLVWAAGEVDLELCKKTIILENKARNARKRQLYWHSKADQRENS